MQHLNWIRFMLITYFKMTSTRPRMEGFKFKVPTNLLEAESMIVLPKQLIASSYLLFKQMPRF
jgi:hypothetical protein